MSYRFIPSKLQPRSIRRIEFGIFSPAEIINQSVVKVEHEVLYENREPKARSLVDVRMGCIEKDMQCYTCDETIVNCPGHFGHIELNVPIYHIHFIKYVKKILECICHKCFRYRFPPSSDQYKKLLYVKEKFKYAYDQAKTKTSCLHADCDEKVRLLRRSGISLYYDEKDSDKKVTRIPLTAKEAYDILSRISDETCRLIGLDPKNARPEWMIITVLPVPPPCVRPSISVDTSGKSEDDLTHMLTNIIKYNNLVKKHRNSKMVSDFVEQLQIHIATYLDNDVSGVDQITQKGGRPIKSLSARMKGKDGLIRGHLMGKRVDFSARTVITGDPNISVEEIGIPQSIAKNLTFPEIVSSHNIEYLQQLVDRSPSYPGAKFVIRNNGKEIWDLQYSKPTVQLGDKVERHLRDGDVVLFNRQPTLHKMSMMAHRVRVMPHLTFRLNVNVCTSYNADFDGDEMNLHVPQSYETQVELLHLSRVSQLLVSPQANKPVNALVQDALCGIRQLTKRDTFLTKDQFFNLVMWLRFSSKGDAVVQQFKKSLIDVDQLPLPAIIKPIPLWTGKQLLSLMLPPINLVGNHSTHQTGMDEFKHRMNPTRKQLQSWIDQNPNDTRVIIENGELISGIICKRTAGSSSGSIVHIIWQDYGSEAACDFMDNASQIIVQWMLMTGFTVGLGDTIVQSETKKRIFNAIAHQYEKSRNVIADYNKGTLVSQGRIMTDELKEISLQEILAKARDVAGSIANSALASNNNIKQMVEAGSKGSVLNICQISACVGQQIVDGKRIPYGFRRRTLPHFDNFDDSPESRGFVESSFITGLKPHEVFFHAMGGREGLIDTSIKTAESGYIQRRLIKALEDVCVKYDGTVRNSRGDVIQFYYGEDGFDGTVIEMQTFDTMLLSNDDFARKYHVDELHDSEWNMLCLDRKFLRDNMRLPEDKWALPLNLKRIIKNAQCQFQTSARQTKFEPLTYRYVYETVFDLRRRLRPSRLIFDFEEPDRTILLPSFLFGILLSSVLASRQVIDRYRLTKEAFDWIVRQIEIRYYRGLVQPGESVGVIAAQSIGEPATQMTLNVFHLSGTGNKAVTTGIPRLKELINAVKSLKTPSMTLYLQDDIRLDYKRAKQVKSRVEHCVVSQLIQHHEIVYDPDYRNSTIATDRHWLDILNSIPDEDMPTSDKLHPWMLRLELSRYALMERVLSIHQVAKRIREEFENDILEMHCDDNQPTLVIHLRLFKDFEDVQEPLNEVLSKRFLEDITWDLLQSITVAGIAGVTKAFVSQKPIVEYDSDGVLSTHRKEFFIETEGINMKHVRKISGIDISRSYCNDPQEMLNIFGIEIARTILMGEIRGVIESGGSYINHRHLCLLCELMTYRGIIMAITRHGINKTDLGPLTKSTFEQVVEVLVDASTFGDKDEIKGVAEHIMVGATPPIGTGMMQIVNSDNWNCKNVDTNDNDDWEELEHILPDEIDYSLIDVHDDDVDNYSPLRPSYLKGKLL
jgi:DNA-directed RNA polymerase II subunit RPB1